mgnify:CR=1 FL=1
MKIQFNTDNAAFEEYGLWEETDRILKDISYKIRLGYEYGPVRDINGNKIGTWSL